MPIIHPSPCSTVVPSPSPASLPGQDYTPKGIFKSRFPKAYPCVTAQQAKSPRSTRRYTEFDLRQDGQVPKIPTRATSPGAPPAKMQESSLAIDVFRQQASFFTSSVMTHLVPASSLLMEAYPLHIRLRVASHSAKSKMSKPATEPMHWQVHSPTLPTPPLDSNFFENR
jgi:hypothetical protein